MKLRSILFVLSLLSFLSASIGGYLYYASLKEAAFKEAERQALLKVELIRKTLSSYLSENIKPVRALASMDEMLNMLTQNNRQALHKANKILDQFKAALEVDVCYLMDHEGNTIASSNRDAPDSFVGKNFAFRPYFQQAIHSAPSTYLALGVTSGKRGVYYSYPIFEKGEDLPIGLVVIKASIDRIEKKLVFSPNDIVMVTSPKGIIFISNQKEWLFQSAWKLGEQQINVIVKSRQFGNGPWEWVGLTPKNDHRVIDNDGNQFIMHQREIENYSDWHVIHMRSLQSIHRTVYDPLFRVTGPIVLSLCFMVGVGVFFLYQKASHEIGQRKAAEKALRESEVRYRSLYLNTPAMLHSIDKNGQLVSVSDHWVDMLGYQRNEVLGRRITNFFTEESRQYAEQIVFPQFFKSGFCKDVSYQFVKKDGGVIDVLLSAIAEKDATGTITRTLAVSVDVTERNRAVAALEKTKEELSHYSRDLERQVVMRTREISSILKYTPAMVYLKDREGRYLLVNSRYEELFGVKNEEIRGKTDYQILKRSVADQFKQNDAVVFNEGRSYQVEEQFDQIDGLHTYLSVKFPLYNDSGHINGICGIATDITAVKKAQNQLRRLSGSIMTNQEKERSALARELHDELGQVLTALRLDAAWLRDRLKDIDAKAADRALTMTNLIDTTIEEVRGMAFRLRPGVLDDLGLVDALEWYTHDFERRTGISCVFEHRNFSEIGDTLATAAYRITQEALTNVARHAKASRVDVILHENNGMLSIQIKDNGIGFKVTDLAESEGLGVAGMRERASLVGGWLEVDSKPTQGTQVNFKVSFDSN